MKTPRIVRLYDKPKLSVEEALAILTLREAALFAEAKKDSKESQRLLSRAVAIEAVANGISQ